MEKKLRQSKKNKFTNETTTKRKDAQRSNGRKALNNIQ